MRFKAAILFFAGCLIISIGHAQQEDNAILDIFEHENLLDLKNRDIISGKNTDVTYIRKLSFEQYSAEAIDSVIGILQTGNIADINKFTSALYLDSAAGSMESFISMHKRAFGNLLSFQLLKRETIFIKTINRNYGVVTLKAGFAKASGILTLYFRLSDTNKFEFAKLAFFPYDNQNNAFMKAIAQNDIHLLQMGNYRELEQNFTDAFKKKLGKTTVKFENELLGRVITDSLFTFRLYTHNRQLFAVPVFYTGKPAEFLSMRYAVIGKKFMLDMLVVLKKD